MIAEGWNLRVSRPDADARSAKMVPATTTSTPRSASRCLQRFLTPRMTSTSSERWSMQRSPLELRLQEFLFPGEVIRDRAFEGEEHQTCHQQIPPQALAAFRFLARHFLGGDR